MTNFSTVLLTPSNHSTGTYSFKINQAFEHDLYGDGISNQNHKKSNIPKRVILSWHSLTIKARVRNLAQTIVSCCKSVNKRKERFETILYKVRGIVEPGELLGLMGARYNLISFFL